MRTIVEEVQPASPTVGAGVGLAVHELELAVEWIAISEIRNSDRNARKHSDRQTHQIAESIKTFGFVVPIICNDRNVIVAGHGRLAAAKLLGMSKVPVIRLRHLDEEKIRALRLADNKIASNSGWDEELLAAELQELSVLELDFDLEVIGFSSGELDIILDGKTDLDGADPADEVPEPEESAVSRLGDLWLLGEHRLFCGSALEASSYEQVMAGEKARTVFTDLPYNVRIAGHVSGLGRVKHPDFKMGVGELSEPGYIDFSASSMGHMTDHLVEGGIFFSCIDWRHLYEMQVAVRRIGLTMLNLCVWDKGSGGMGSFYRSQHEFVLVLKKGTAPHQNLVELGRHGRYRTNVWSYPGLNSFRAGRMQELSIHPTCKPVPLVADAIRDCTRRGELVLDGFSGSGTTIIAAQKCGRRAAAIEIEPRYVDVAIRRWQKLTGQKALLGGTGHSFEDAANERLGEVDHV
jgi:DNA modification methylase